jgi:hypothetical protein
VKTIFFAIQIYWPSLFFRSKADIKQIKKTLRAFLWKGSEMSTKICLCEKEREFRIKSLEQWNKIAM